MEADMPLTFYPHDEDVAAGSVQDRLEMLMEGAERYKATVLDVSLNVVDAETKKRRMTPKDIKYAFNWQEIAKILREIRDLPESNASSKAAKADRLTRLADIYEVLRSAKLPKLEAVRMALMSEATQLRTAG
jgi:hypothetical protein